MNKKRVDVETFLNNYKSRTEGFLSFCLVDESILHCGHNKVRIQEQEEGGCRNILQ